MGNLTPEDIQVLHIVAKQEIVAAIPEVGNLWIETDKEGNPTGMIFGKYQPVVFGDSGAAMQMYPESHFQIWKELPNTITKGRDFMEVPRIRICYMKKANEFVLYANSRYLANPNFKNTVLQYLHIGRDRTIRHAEDSIVDEHYPWLGD